MVVNAIKVFIMKFGLFFQFFVSIVLDGVLGPPSQHATPDGILATLQFRKQRTRIVDGP